MGVAADGAVTGEVLQHGDNSLRKQTFRETGNHPGNLLRITAVGTDGDFCIGDIRTDIRHGGKIQIKTIRRKITTDDLAGGESILRRFGFGRIRLLFLQFQPVRHAGHAAAFLVHADEQADSV